MSRFVIQNALSGQSKLFVLITRLGLLRARVLAYSSLFYTTNADMNHGEVFLKITHIRKTISR